MKLTYEQRIWLKNYATARLNGGVHDNDLGWVPFDEIPTPEWYKEWATEGAGQSEAEESPKVESSNEGATPSPSTAVAEERKKMRLWFTNKGKLGGEKTKATYGIEHYQRIGRMGGRGHKK